MPNDKDANVRCRSVRLENMDNCVRVKLQLNVEVLVEVFVAMFVAVLSKVRRRHNLSEKLQVLNVNIVSSAR